MIDKTDDKILPVMMYLHGFMSGANDPVPRQLQEMFKGRYRVIAPELDADIEHSMEIIEEIRNTENPEIIIGNSLGGFIALLLLGNADVVLVNPVTDPYRQLAHWLGQEQTYLCKRLDGVQTYTLTKNVLDKYKWYDLEEDSALIREWWEQRRISALCSSNDELLGGSHIKLLSKYINPDFLIVADDFGHQCKGAGMTHLKMLIEKVIGRREFIKHSTMTFEQYAEMVRNRAIPGNPGFYHLDVYAFNSTNVYNENIDHCYLPNDRLVAFERYIDQGNVNYRIPVNCDANGLSPLSADYATREEAMNAMLTIAGNNGLLGFIISRYGFGQFSHDRYPLEQWMYNADGRFVQKAACSSFHYRAHGLYGKFLGHETLPYKKGDKVVILHRYVGNRKMYAVPGIIIEESDDLKKGYEIYTSQIENWIRKGNSPETWNEETIYPGSDEDEYFVQYGSDDSSETHFTFQHPLSIFPLPFPLPKEIEDEMDEWYKEYRSHNSD